MDEPIERILFVDVDGPLINTPCYYINHLASIEREVFNTQALGYLIELSKKADAKIVMNSTHNTFAVPRETADQKPYDSDLRTDMVKWGVPEELFHKDWRTTYPWPPESKFSEASESRRQRAINLWIEKNGIVDWIALDDEYFTEDPRLILVDFDRGIDYDIYRKVKEFWKIEKKDDIIL